MYIMTAWVAKDEHIAAIKYGFEYGGTENTELFSDKAFIALNISIATNVVNYIVEGFILPLVK